MAERLGKGYQVRAAAWRPIASLSPFAGQQFISASGHLLPGTRRARTPAPGARAQGRIAGPLLGSRGHAFPFPE